MVMLSPAYKTYTEYTHVSIATFQPVKLKSKISYVTRNNLGAADLDLAFELGNVKIAT